MASDGRNHWDEGPRIELRGDPAYRQRTEAEEYGAEPEAEVGPARGGRGRFGPLRFALVGLLLIGFGGLVLYAYSWGTGDPAPEELPVVAAPEGPEKERPESPGGMEVPYQDTMVLNPGGQPEEGVERLLPPPEEPRLPAPEPEPSQTAERTDAPDTSADEPAQPAAEQPTATEGANEQAPAEEIEVSEAPLPGEAEPEAAPAEEAADPEPQPAPEEPQQNAAAEPAEPETQEAPAAAAEGAFMVQLASASNQEAVEREWTRMQERHPEQLGGLSLNVERADLGDRGVFYRLQAGPLSSRDAAESLCAELKAQQQDCLVRAR